MDWRGTTKPLDLDKAKSTIRQFYRDWSREGGPERKACYEPVLNDVAQAFTHVPDKSLINILIPGAGLGRLVFEFCRLGFTVEGNEISYHQLMASNWVLNNTKAEDTFDFQPFALDFSNMISRDHQMRKVKIPDVHPATELGKDIENTSVGAYDRMSMTAADFLILYNDEEHTDVFDAVVTVYFVDTAPNVIKYIETVRNCLKDSGIWVNLGPLLWHFADRGPLSSQEQESERGTSEKAGIAEPGSFELTDEELLKLVESMGFEMEKREIRNDGLGYIQNPDSMLQTMYRTSHWIARKKAIC